MLTTSIIKEIVSTFLEDESNYFYGGNISSNT